MKNNFITGFLVAVIIGVAVGVTLYFTKENKLPVRKVYVDTHKTELANYKKLAELKEKQLVESEGVIYSLQGKLSKTDRKLAGQKERADSAQARYEREKTIGRCDSTIAAKNAVIATQSDKLSDYEVTVAEYTNNISILKDLDKTHQLMIDSQGKTIREQTEEIEANSCCRQWFVDHKFWRWLHGVKCN